MAPSINTSDCPRAQRIVAFENHFGRYRGCFYSAFTISCQLSGAEITPTKYSKILLPVKHLNRVKSAAGHAIHIAKKHDATLTILAVIDLPDQESKTSGHSHIQDTREGEAELRHLLEIVERTAKGEGVITQSVVLESGGRSVGKVISSYANRNGIDLIVVGATARSFDAEVGKLSLGGIVDVLLLQAECPILLVS